MKEFLNIAAQRGLKGANSVLNAPVRATFRAAFEPARLMARAARLHEGVTRSTRYLLIQALVLISVFALASNSSAITPPGTTIGNTAKATFDVGPSIGITSFSNQLNVTTVRTPSSIQLLAYAPVTGTPYNVAAGPYGAPFSYLAGGPIAVPSAIPLAPATSFHAGEPVFIMVTDLDQNVNPLIAETVITTITSSTGDSETMTLTETGPNTGIFITYIQSTTALASPNNGALSVALESTITATYTDSSDGSDTSAEAGLIDPYGVVFDSTNGSPVNGATVTLWNVLTNSPAAVLGDDGISTYPSTVTSGGTAVDSSSNVYTFPAGTFRFPLVAPGTYKFIIVPPAGYSAPTVVTDAVLQTLPGNPFALTIGSRGENFVINPGPALHIDIPIDPATGSNLLVGKKAAKEVVGIGEFLQYKITVTNGTLALLTNVLAIDTLPLGFKYENGSAMLNGSTPITPVISPDGRTMTFTIPTLTGGGKAEITYVVFVGPGAKAGVAKNTASASSGALSSNTAVASVKVKDDLGAKTTIVGRVFPFGCEAPTNDSGVEGVIIMLEDGTYTTTDKNGMYHFEGVTPGTHVVQMDVASLPANYEPASCVENTRFARRNFSQFVDLQKGSLWRADFYAKLKPKAKGTASITLGSSLKGSEILYTLKVSAASVPLTGVSISIFLPEGTEYAVDSSLVQLTKSEPEVLDGILIYRINEVKPGAGMEITYRAKITGEVTARDFESKASMNFSTPSAKNQRMPLVKNVLIRAQDSLVEKGKEYVLRPHFPVLSAELQDEDKTALDKLVKEYKGHKVTRIYAEGHTDSTPIAKKNVKIYADNFALSDARARSVASYLAAALGLGEDSLTISGKGSTEPLTSNKDVAGRAKNRRVELKIVSDKITAGSAIDKKATDEASAEMSTEGTRPGEAPVSTETEEKEPLAPHRAISPEGKTPELEILWPAEGYHPPIATTGVAIKHAPKEHVKVFVNGEEVDALFYESMDISTNGAAAISRWTGVQLNIGDNELEAVLYGQDKNEVKRVKRVVHYSDHPVEATVINEKSTLVADGKTAPIVAVRFVDRFGHPAREGVIGEYAVEPPYSSLEAKVVADKAPITMGQSKKTSYKIGKDGVALIKLAPTTKTGEASIRFRLDRGERSVKAWLKPEMRDWVLVGFAEGTLAGDTIKKNIANAKDAGNKDGYYEDGTLAFYAKGSIKGEHLMTIAYDSRRGSNYDPSSLHGIIDPGTYYTVYGDGSEQRYDAASSRALYVKIEKEQFYALFGDYDTGMTVTELSRYSRTYNGLKSEYKGEKYSYTAFAADTNQAFIKDELRGDGTSGIYNLSRANIVINSDKIRIEVRDRFRSEVIITTKMLARHTDYDINYDASTLFFKEPVPTVDENLNPVFIVAEYESYDDNDRRANFGGRGAIKHDNGIETGATFVHEGRIGARANLYGVDATVPLTEKTKLKAEAARTNREFAGDTVWGSAGLAEVTHENKNYRGKAYVREEMSSFGLGHQPGSEGGIRKLGLEGAYDLTPKSKLNVRAYEENNRTTHADRYVLEANNTYTGKGFSLEAGVLDTTEKYDTGTDFKSTQLKLGGTKDLMNGKLKLRAKHELSFVNNEAPNHPTRTTLGADYKLAEKASLFATHEITKGENENSFTTTAGIKAQPWNGSEASSSVAQDINENGSRVFSNVGLRQKLQLDKHWDADAGIEHGKTLRHDGSPQFNLNYPKASGGGEDYTSVALGLAYKEIKWGWTARLEFRNGDNEKKRGFYGGYYGEPMDGIGISAAVRFYRTDNAANIIHSSDAVRLGFAYRPKVTKLIVLDKLDIVREDEKGSGSTNPYDNRKVLNLLNVNYKHDFRNELSLIYGSKYSRETISSNSYYEYTDLIGLEGRHDLTEKFDIGLYGGMLHSYRTKQYDYRLGASIGYNLMQNAWISVGYNFKGFTDKDFSKADFTSRGSFIKLRLKFDQETAKDAVRWFTGQ